VRTTKKLDLIPRLPAKISRELLPSQDVAINSIVISIESLNDLARALPAKYGWRVRSVEALQAEALKLKNSRALNPHALNQLYWTDMLKTCEAYSIMITWRAVELARSCIWALARDDIHCSALTARAALEGTAQYLDFTRATCATLDQILAATLLNDVAISSELESFLLKTVFASRLPEESDVYEPIRIGKIIGRVGKIKGQEFLEPTYAELCEVAHPNFFGRSIYIISAVTNDHPGDQTRLLGLERGPTSKLVIRSSVRALSWASMTHVTAFMALRQSTGSFLEKLGLGKELGRLPDRK
jgi:hypothetical protein